VSVTRAIRTATVVLVGGLALGSAVAWHLQSSTELSTLEVRVSVMVCVQDGGCSQLPLPGASVVVLAGNRERRATADDAGIATVRVPGTGSFPLHVTDSGLAVTAYSGTVLIASPSVTVPVVLARLCCAVAQGAASSS
jgi:hypothetical protein